MVSPYRLPDDGEHRVINFSGGRSSGYMLWHILDAHDGALPENTVVCFANTGMERGETLVFVDQCARHWDVPIAWLEYRYVPEAAGRRQGHWKHRHEVVTVETASRDGEPYGAMIAAKSMLPNIARSFCTTKLKVEPVEWYCKRDLGWASFRKVIGFRYDERRRWGAALLADCGAEYPMVHARVDKAAVAAWWGRRNFDLGIRSDEGNCTLCFKKGRDLLVRLIGENPPAAKPWIDWEERQGATFSKRFAYRELRDEALTSDPVLSSILGGAPEEGVADCVCDFDDA